MIKKNSFFVLVLFVISPVYAEQSEVDKEFREKTFGIKLLGFCSERVWLSGDKPKAKHMIKLATSKASELLALNPKSEQKMVKYMNEMDEYLSSASEQSLVATCKGIMTRFKIK